MRGIIKVNSITEEKQVRRGVDQELHERLSDYFCRVAIRKHHVHHAVEWEEKGNFRDNQKFLDCGFASKAGNACNEVEESFAD